MSKIIPIDVADFIDKIECIVITIEDNSKVGGEIKGGTVRDLGKEFIRIYKRLRPYRSGWQLKKIKYMPMRKPNSRSSKEVNNEQTKHRMRK